MRTYALFSVAALSLLAACTGSRADDAASASPSPLASPAPLRACETRELTIDGADVVVQANVDRTLGAIVVAHADDDTIRTHALADAAKLFGEPHPDTRTTQRQSKWGLIQITDPCGRPVSPPPIKTSEP